MPKTDEDYIKLAIDEAHKAQAAGLMPLGVVIVKDDQVIVRGTSHVGDHLDPTAHGESLCMRLACQELRTLDLSGFTLYSTVEPCSMCLSCAGWTGLSKIVFGAYQADTPDNPYELTNYHAEEHAKNFRIPLIVKGGVLREECKNLLKNVKNWQIET